MSESAKKSITSRGENEPCLYEVARVSLAICPCFATVFASFMEALHCLNDVDMSSPPPQMWLFEFKSS